MQPRVATEEKLYGPSEHDKCTGSINLIQVQWQHNNQPLGREDLNARTCCQRMNDWTLTFSTKGRLRLDDG